MKTFWYIEDCCSGDGKKLYQEVVRQGYESKLFPLFEWNLDDVKDKVWIGHGSIQTALQMRGGNPGFEWFDFDALKCSTYYAYYGKHLLISDGYAILPMAEFGRMSSLFFDWMGVGDTLFVRPDTNGKRFKGGLIYKEYFVKDFEQISKKHTNSCQHDLVVVARPWRIEAEWRFLIVDREVITGSQYASGGFVEHKSGFEEGALDRAKAIAKEEWRPSEVFVVDICKTGDEYALLEIGEFNCAGMYCWDLPKVVDTISKHIEKTYSGD